MRLCKKCGKQFPTRVKIGDKYHNTGNRKFCLKCSPFGSHNTKPDDPNRKSIYGQENGKKKPYSTWSEEAKDYNRACQYWRRQETKSKLVELAGGKCRNCGYNKSNKALQFHHIDPSTKHFELSSFYASKNWELILEEFKKCELLCANCHAEKEEQAHESKYTKYKMGGVGLEPTMKAL